MRWIFQAALVANAWVASVAYAEKYALIVGVNECREFQMPNGSQSRPLRGAENDADAMRTLVCERLGFKPENVTVLKGKSATWSTLKAVFAEAARQLTGDDEFLFHFSGHGTQVADRAPFDEEDRLDEALCPADARADGAKLILDDQLGRWLEDLPARRVTVILDSCHSGTGVKSDDDDVASRYLPIRSAGATLAADRPWRELAGATKSLDRETCMLYACQSNQEAYERRFLEYSPPRRMGQFTHYLIQGLTDNGADSNHDQQIAAREIESYISNRLDSAFNPEREPSGKQHPNFELSRDDLPLFSAAAAQ